MKTSTIEQLGVIMRPGMIIRRKNTNNIDNIEVKTVNNLINQLKINIKNFEFFANIGVYSHEKDSAQKLIMNLEICLDKNIKIEDDELVNTIDYVLLAKMADEIAKSKHFNLIETFAQTLATQIMLDDRIEKLSLTIAKPSAIKNAHSAQVTIECSRS